MVLGFLTVGPQEIAIILVIALVVFGPERLPQIGKQIGMAYRELNRLRGDMHRALDIEEYTRVDMPDLSLSGDAYSYTSPVLNDTESAHENSYDWQNHAILPLSENDLVSATAPPGPPLDAIVQTTATVTAPDTVLAHVVVSEGAREVSQANSVSHSG